MLGRRKKQSETSEAPSGIEAPNKIDFIAVAPDRSSIDLHIAQNVEWDGSDRVLTLLQEKIHNYVGFAVDGQLAASYSEHAGLPWRVVIDCQTEPDPRTSEMLDALEAPIAKYGGTLVRRPPGR
jgi:hypothetical protein